MKKIFTFILIFFFSHNAFAISIIRDAEIENVLRNISNPIFKAAKLENEIINIYIVNDREFNAYVSGGSNIFINTGLLGMSEDPHIITGVIAHETGHIAGGHLLLSSHEHKATAIKATFGYMLGLAAAAAGSPQAAIAIAQGTGHVSQRNLFKYSRTHEEAADQAALSYLEAIKEPASGLLEILEILSGKENQLYEDLNPYTSTHPLSKERIAHVRNHLDNSKFKKTDTSTQKAKDFQRAIIKLNAFLDPYEKTLEKYPESDNSINARYARAIAHYKIPDIEKSLEEIDLLIKTSPTDPFFHELKGQILFENGHVKESVPYYQKAVDLLPNSALLKIILATAQISTEDEDMIKKSIPNLKKALIKEKDNTFAWHRLGIAYGRIGDLGMSNLALAEEAYVTDNKRDVRKFIGLAKQYLEAGSPAELRANDLLSYINEK